MTPYQLRLFQNILLPFPGLADINCQMQEMADMELLRQYALGDSEEAFAALVTRHVNLVYSAALRKTGNADAAGEITQAVFIILARKAGGLRRETVLSGWLYQTTRLTSANFLRTEIRRVRREQEAYMQSLPEESARELWSHILPLLEDAMGRLGEKDRDALTLRFFEGLNFKEVGTALGTGEDAAKMRVNRALEKLRKFFAKRGVSSTAAVIAGALSAHSVQAAPVTLAKSVTVVALAKGAAAGGSTLIITQGTLKVMAWTKLKTTVAIGVGLLLATATTTSIVKTLVIRYHSILTQRLPDGSLLELQRTSFGAKNVFKHGDKTDDFTLPGKNQLVAEFRLSGKDPASHLLTKPAFYRQFRCVLRGEKGIEYVEEFWPGSKFKSYADGYFGYLIASSFPHDSAWLWVRIEQRDDRNNFAAWHTVAEFKTANPAPAEVQKWQPSPTPATNFAGGLAVVLGEITVKTVPNYPHDIWNHIVSVPTGVWENGVLQSNWAPTYIQAQDASGNWLSLAGKHRSLDPRYVWKLEMDLEPQSNFTAENTATFDLPKKPGTFIIDVMNTPVTISWDGSVIDASIPANPPDQALKFLSATDAQGGKYRDGNSSWGQFQFRAGGFMKLTGEFSIEIGQPTKATIAIVPNIHATFYAQPRLLTD